jgi:hypothetical protein
MYPRLHCKQSMIEKVVQPGSGPDNLSQHDSGKQICKSSSRTPHPRLKTAREVPRGGDGGKLFEHGLINFGRGFDEVRSSRVSLASSMAVRE